jgi:hypothetical protein
MNYNSQKTPPREFNTACWPTARETRRSYELPLFTDATSDLRFLSPSSITNRPADGIHDGRQDYSYIPGNSEMPIETFFAKMRAGEPVTTAQINTYLFRSVRARAQGGRGRTLYRFFLQLSGTVQSAFTARKSWRPSSGRKVNVVDSLSASLGEGCSYTTPARKRRGWTLTALPVGRGEQAQVCALVYGDDRYTSSAAGAFGRYGGHRTILNISPSCIRTTAGTSPR